MKKIIALALSLILVLSLSVTAFAAGEVTANNGTSVAPVTGKYEEGTGAVDTYCVDISWTGLSFTFTAAQKTWDPVNHVEVDAENGSWSDDGEITVKNHSNVKITATAVWAAGEYDGDVTIEVGAPINLDAPTTANAVEGTISATPNGNLAKDYNGTLGGITITITKFVPAT